MRGKLFVSVLVLIIAIGAILAFTSVREQKRSPGLAVQTLPDGRQVIIQAITFGTNHTFTHGSRFLARVKQQLPASWHKWLGTQHHVQQNTTEPTAIIWYSGFDPATGQFVSLAPDRFRVVDDHGCVFHISQYGGGMQDPSFTIQHAYVPTLPRRQKGFTFRATFSGQPPLEFKLPNPAHRATISEWTPEGLPATRTLGHTNFTLTGIRGYFNQRGHWFEPRLKIAVEGEDRTKWFRPQFKYRDATGNHSYTLCPFERAWRVDCEIFHSHEAPFPEGRITRLADLTLPKPGEVIPLSQAETLGNVSMQFVALCGPGEYTFSNGVCIASAPYDQSMSGETFSTSSSSGPPPHVELSFRRREPSLIVNIHGLERSDRLMLRGRDESNRLFRASFNGSADRTYRYGLEVTNATRFALEIIPQEPLQLEYTVAPPRPDK